MKKVMKYLVLFCLVMILFLITASMVFAIGTTAPNIVKGVWWILTALVSAVMAYLNFSKKYQGTIPAKITLIIQVAAVVFGVIFATPWAPPSGP